MKSHLPVVALVTMAAFHLFNATVRAAPPRPKPLPEPFKCSALLVLPDGGLLVTGTGSSAPTEQSYRWTPDDGNWSFIAQTEMWGTLAVSALNKSNLSITGRGGFVSKDGGKTWQKAFPREVTHEGKEFQINQAFWSTKKPDTLLLTEITFDQEPSVFELDLPTGKIGPRSKIKAFFSRYEQVEGKHFGWMGPTDEMPPKCVVSEDDGKTWKPVAPEQSPWALHASAQAQFAKLAPSKNKNARPAVTWAVEIAGTAFCRIESLVGEKLSPSLPTLFTSLDHGKTWVPAVLSKRTADLRTIFAQSPFVSKDSAGRLNIDPNGDLEFKFDADTQQIFAGLKGEWFATTPTDREWHRINALPR